MLVKSRTSSLLLLLSLLILVVELLFVRMNFDAHALLKNTQLHDWQQGFAYLGLIVKQWLLITVFFIILARSRLPEYFQQITRTLSMSRYGSYLAAHFVCFMLFFYLTGKIFTNPLATNPIPAMVFFAWIIAGLATVYLLFRAVFSSQHLHQLIWREKITALTAIAASCLTVLLTLLTESGWGVMAEYTFSVTRFLLSGYGDQLLYTDASNKIIGLGDFVITVAPECSGYQGIGLVTGFSALYVYLHRATLKFPQALWIFPLGATLIWLLNCVRIAILLMIGHHWSPDIAVGGFHSQAGWISFLLTSLLLLWFAGRSSWLQQQPQQIATNNSLNLAIATLIPLVTLLAAGLLSSALTADFDYLYPLRVFAVAIALYKVWPWLNFKRYTLHWETAAIALLVAVLWELLLPAPSAAASPLPAGLDAMTGYWADSWMTFRVLGAVVTVPIAEELAFRAYLLCKLSTVAVTTEGVIAIKILPVLLSSIAFGALHQAWIAGTIAGLLYALLRFRTRHIADCIVAHAGTNCLLVIYAAFSGHWLL